MCRMVRHDRNGPSEPGIVRMLKQAAGAFGAVVVEQVVP
jgi:hypothetical protein